MKLERKKKEKKVDCTHRVKEWIGAHGSSSKKTETETLEKKGKRLEGRTREKKKKKKKK